MLIVNFRLNHAFCLFQSVSGNHCKHVNVNANKKNLSVCIRGHNGKSKHILSGVVFCSVIVRVNIPLIVLLGISSMFMHELNVVNN